MAHFWERGRDQDGACKCSLIYVRNPMVPCQFSEALEASFTFGTEEPCPTSLLENHSLTFYRMCSYGFLCLQAGSLPPPM